MRNLLVNILIMNFNIIIGVIAYEALDSMLYEIKEEYKND